MVTSGIGFRSFSLAAACALVLVTTAHADDKKKNTVTGALVGAGVGALVGDGKGAVIGGVAGAIIGHNWK